MAPNNPPLAMPTEAMPLTKSVLDTTVSIVWWRFFFGLYKRSQADIPFLVGPNLAGGGTVQADALVLTADWSEIVTVPLNSGVLLANFGIGFGSWIWNAGANPLNVYPPLGCTIDAGAANAPYSLAASKAQLFSQLTATRFRSLQLG